MAFVAYQSQIAKGFQFIQNVWANDYKFAPNKDLIPGWDPIIGQNAGMDTFMTGADINTPNMVLGMLPEFVLSRGGEYFFSPSISALTNVLSV